MRTTISALFDISYGLKAYHNKEWLEADSGTTALISSKGEDNGVYGFFDIEPHYKAPFITVPSTGTVGQAFVQTIDAAVDDNCLVLLPKETLSLEVLYQVSYQIRKNKWKYKYGRQITPLRLGRQEIIINQTEKNWLSFQKSISQDLHPIRHQASKPDIKIYKLVDFFRVTRGTGSYLEKLGPGVTPVISTQVANSGVCGFYDIEPTFKAPAITIGRIMCNPSIQLQDFATVPDDMFVLVPKKDYDLSFLYYISSIIKKEGWRFNYSRKATKAKLELLDIPLPVDKTGKVYFDYIEQLIKVPGLIAR